MVSPRGFWSYVHLDDEADGGRIVQLAKDIVSRYGILTGETIDLFLDKDSIEWGEDWEGKVDDSLARVAFFVPVITPRYFQSVQCRRELHFFADRAIALGLQELILPILYIDVPDLHEPSNDRSVELVRKFQWEDWRELQFFDVTSSEYRRAVDRLARRLVSANETLATVPVAPATPPPTVPGRDVDLRDQELGTLDKMAAAEEAMPEWTGILEQIGQRITEIGELMVRATEQMQRAEKQGKGFAARLTVARQLSNELREPVDAILSLSQEYTSRLYAVDGGFKEIIARAPAEANANEENRRTICEFFDSTKQLSGSAGEGLLSVGAMIEAIRPVESMSRDLRPVLRDLRQALTVMLEGKEVTDEWARLVDAAPVSCPDLESSTNAS